MPAEMLIAIERLAEVCQALVQQSRLLNLPEEMLLRVLRELDAAALGSLACTARFFHTGSPKSLLDHACDEAAVWQHGAALAALRPQRLTAARRLRSLEQAMEAGPNWAREAAYSVREGYTFLWPAGYTSADKDLGGFHLAVLRSASASGAIKPVEEEAVENTAPTSPTWAHKAAINLAAQLAAPSERRGGGGQPLSRPGAVDFLAEQLCRTDIEAANDSFTLGVVEALCHPNHEDPAMRHAPQLGHDDESAGLKARLVWALWLRSRSKVGEDAAQSDQATIHLALELLEKGGSSSARHDAEREELLRWLLGAMELQPDNASSSSVTATASNGTRVRVQRRSLEDIRSELVSSLCKRGQASHALSSLALPRARSILSTPTAAWETVRPVVADLSTISRALEDSDVEVGVRESALRWMIKLLEAAHQHVHEGRNGSDASESLRLEAQLLSPRAKLARLLWARGSAAEAEQQQRLLVDQCAAQLKQRRHLLEERRAQLMCFGLRWVKRKGEPREGRLLTNARLSEALSPSSTGALFVRLSRDKTKHVFDRSTFDGFGFTLALEDLPKDSYVEVGDAYWAPKVPASEYQLLEELNRVSCSLDTDMLEYDFAEHQTSIAGGGSWRRQSCGRQSKFTDAQGLHTMLLSRGKLEEAAELLEPLESAYFQVLLVHP